eukprot:m.333839 g.333839  ORF g.333839 m.333839 type:complete len:605 (+) comp17230_c0_seq1:6333-8147(+)
MKVAALFLVMLPDFIVAAVPTISSLSIMEPVMATSTNLTIKISMEEPVTESVVALIILKCPCIDDLKERIKTPIVDQVSSITYPLMDFELLVSNEWSLVVHIVPESNPIFAEAYDSKTVRFAVLDTTSTFSSTKTISSRTATISRTRTATTVTATTLSNTATFTTISKTHLPTKTTNDMIDITASSQESIATDTAIVKESTTRPQSTSLPPLISTSLWFLSKCENILPNEQIHISLTEFVSLYSNTTMTQNPVKVLSREDQVMENDFCKFKIVTYDYTADSIELAVLSSHFCPRVGIRAPYQPICAGLSSDFQSPATPGYADDDAIVVLQAKTTVSSDESRNRGGSLSRVAIIIIVVLAGFFLMAVVFIKKMLDGRKAENTNDGNGSQKNMLTVTGTPVNLTPSPPPTPAPNTIPPATAPRSNRRIMQGNSLMLTPVNARYRTPSPVAQHDNYIEGGLGPVYEVPMPYSDIRTWQKKRTNSQMHHSPAFSPPIGYKRAPKDLNASGPIYATTDSVNASPDYDINYDNIMNSSSRKQVNTPSANATQVVRAKSRSPYPFNWMATPKAGNPAYQSYMDDSNLYDSRTLEIFDDKSSSPRSVHVVDI